MNHITQTKGKNMKSHQRRVGDVIIVDLNGRLTLGAGDVELRRIVQDVLEQGGKQILLNLDKVGYMDSSGTGELVSCFTSAANRGAKLKLLNLSSRIRDLLQFTQLISVFENYSDEAEAIASFDE